MAKITKGFLATKKHKLIKVTVSIYDLGFYIVTEGDGPPKQSTRNTPYRAKLFVDSIRAKLEGEGYQIKDLKDHSVSLSSKGIYKVKI